MFVDVEGIDRWYEHFWGSWGQPGVLKDEGWHYHLVSQRGMAGHRVTLEVWLDVFSPEYPSWFYFDVSGELYQGPYWRAVEVRYNGAPAIGATLRPGWIDGAGNWFPMINTQDVKAYTDHTGRGNSAFWGDPTTARWGFKVHYFDGTKLHEAIVGPIKEGEVPVVEFFSEKPAKVAAPSASQSAAGKGGVPAVSPSPDDNDCHGDSCPI